MKLGTPVALVHIGSEKILSSKLEKSVKTRRIMKKYTVIMAGVVAIASTLLLQQAKANVNSVTGQIDFNGGGTLYQNTLGTGTMATSLGTANSIDIPGSSGDAQTVEGASETGSYIGVPDGTAVTWKSPLSFALGSQRITQLWTFTWGTTVYSFDLSSITSWTAGAYSAALLGTGTLDITGLTSSTGTFELSLTDASGGAGGSAQFTFAASNYGPPPGVPDGGLTIALLGGALVGLQMLRRRLV